MHHAMHVGYWTPLRTPLRRRRRRRRKKKKKKKRKRRRTWTSSLRQYYTDG